MGVGVKGKNFLRDSMASNHIKKKQGLSFVFNVLF